METQYVIARPYGYMEARSVRVSSNGNLVDAQKGSCCYARRGEQWPALYDSHEAAEAAIEAAEHACEHDWAVVSHEEMQCRKCGAVHFEEDL